MELQRSRKDQHKRERDHIPPTRAGCPAGRRGPGDLTPSVLNGAPACGRRNLLGDPGRTSSSSRFLPVRRLRRLRPSPTQLEALCPPALPSEARFRPFGCAPGGHLEQGHTRVTERFHREYFEDLYGRSEDPWKFATSGALSQKRHRKVRSTLSWPPSSSTISRRTLCSRRFGASSRSLPPRTVCSSYTCARR